MIVSHHPAQASRNPHGLPAIVPSSKVPNPVGSRRSDVLVDSIFHAGLVPLRWLVGGHLLEVCGLSTRGKVRTPILRVTRGLRLFQHPLPAGHFRFPYGPPTHLIDESPSGLPCSACLTYDRLRVHHYSGGNGGSLRETIRVQPPTHAPFGAGVSALFHRLRLTKLTMIHCRYPYRSLPGSYTDLGYQYTELSCLAFHCGHYLLAV